MQVIIDCLILSNTLGLSDAFLYNLCSDKFKVSSNKTTKYSKDVVQFTSVSLYFMFNLDRRFPEPANNMHSVFRFFKLMINSLSSNHFDICETSSVSLCSIILTSL